MMKRALAGLLIGCVFAFTACASQNVSSDAVASVSVSSSTAESIITGYGSSESNTVEQERIDTQNCYSAQEFDWDSLGTERRTKIRNFSDEYYIQSSDTLTMENGIKIKVGTHQFLDNTETLEQNYFNTPPEMAANSNLLNSPLKDGYGIFLVPVTLTNTSAEEQELYLNAYLAAYPKEGPSVWQSELFYRSAVENPTPYKADYLKAILAPNETLTTDLGFFLTDDEATYTPIYLTFRDVIHLPDSSLELHDWFILLTDE